MNKKLVSIEELDAREIKKLVNLAKKFKTNNKISTKTIRNKTLALIFQKPSTRTRLSFEVAMRELGGNSIFLSYADLQLSRGELIKDTAKTLSQYVDIVVIRTFNNSDILEFAENSSIPVINALSNTNHPCQALSDIQTIIENKKNIQNLNISWIGDSNNVFNDFMIASLKLGANFSVSCPKRYFPNKRILKLAKEIADNNGSKLLITTDPIKAAKDADVISTDKIISMGDKNIK